jgi:hypothetical protein
MRKLTILLSCLALGVPTLSAVAQQDKKPAAQPPAGDRPPRGDRPGGGGGGGPGGGMMRGQPMDPAKAKAAQELEATGVAKHAGLNEAQTKALVTAYLAARESHNAAAEKMRQEMRDQSNDGGRPDFQAMQQKMQDLNKSEREKFQKALGSSISAEQGAKVMASLGSFNPQWDRWVDALAELKLDAGKQQQGLEAIEAYIIASEKARGGDREAMRDAMQDAREKLNDSMKKILNDEQFAKFESGMRPGGRGQGGPGGNDGGDRPQRRRPRDGGGNGGGGGK